MASPVLRRIPSSPVADVPPPPEQFKSAPGMSATVHPWLGQILDGKFPLLQYLGGSNQTDLFLTQFGEPSQKAVVKLVPAEPASAPRQLARWSSTAVLTHRHLQHIFQAGRCHIAGIDLLYLVMEQAEENLSQILPQRPLTPEEAREMLPPVVEALAYLHGRNLVHSQLKPENILVVGDRLKISSERVSLPGEFAVSPAAYDPPEIDSTGSSAAADVWSLGIALSEALTQQLPTWDGSENPDPKLPSSLTEPFATVARNCLRFDPRRRWSAAQIIAHLRRDAAAPPALEMPAPQPASEPQKQEKPVGWRPFIAVAVVVVAALLGWKIVSGRTTHQSAAPAAQAQPAQTQAAQTETEQTQAVQAQTAETQTVKTPPAQTQAPQTQLTPPAAKPSPVPAAAQHAVQNASQPIPSAAVTPSPVAHNPPQSSSDAVLHRALPDVPTSARNTISGNVRVGVRVQVDPAGNVVGTSLESPGPSKYFARLAEQAAHDWKFAPAQANGQNIASEWVLHFAFGRTDTDVVPTRVAP